MVAKSALVTAQELLDMPDDDRRYELVRGELRKRLLAGAQHGKLAAKVAAALFNYVKANDLGKVYAAGTGFLIGADPDHVRAPDAAFVRHERVDAVGEVAGFWPGAPTWPLRSSRPATVIRRLRRRSMTGWRQVRRWSFW